MYVVMINGEEVASFPSFRAARKYAEHARLDGLLNNLGYESIGFITPDGADYWV